MPTADHATPLETFGPYVIHERLGLGGMATVHRAKKQGIAGFERGVALKRMLSHLTEDADFVDSFIREAKVASLLVHPNIAQVYDFGRIDGVYFIAMEHVEGYDVRRILRHANRTGHAIPLPVVMSILMELCDALEFAHNFRDENGTPLNIVHRDISPSNLIVAHTGHLKVIDFGIAKASARSLHTESGRAKGKLGYMSPEVAMGHVMGPVSDVFSTGVVAHELLTALPLFTAKTDFETMLRIREGEIDPPSRRNGSCPPELDQVVLAALARDPRSRLPTAGAFRQALDSICHAYGIRPSARDVAEYIARIARETADPYVAERGARSAFGHAGTPSGHAHSAVPNDDLDDWGDVPNPSSRLNVPDMPHFTPTRPPSMSAYGTAAQVPQHLSISHVFSGPIAQPAQLAALPPAPAKRSKAGLVAALLLAITAVGAGIVYVAVIAPQSKSNQAVAQVSLGSVEIAVQPDDAIVEIGGQAVTRDARGAVSLDVGVYSVVVKKDGYVPATASITVKADEPQKLSIALEPLPVVATATTADAGASAVGRADLADDVDKQSSDTQQKSVRGRDRRTKNPRTPEPPEETPEETPPDPEPAGSASVGSAALVPPDPPPVKPPPEVKPTPRPRPPTPTTPARTPVVAATAVTKLSGELPAIKGKGSDVSVVAKMCLDAGGRVTDVAVKKVAPEIAVQLQSALKAWRYKPYVDPTTKQATPVCFPLSFKLVFKKTD